MLVLWLFVYPHNAPHYAVRISHAQAAFVGQSSGGGVLYYSSDLRLGDDELYIFGIGIIYTRESLARGRQVSPWYLDGH